MSGATIFWENLESVWLTMYKTMINGDSKKAVQILNKLIPEADQKDIEMEITINMINSQAIEHYAGYVELYISPKMKRDAMIKMEEYYNYRKKLPYLIVSKYKAYHKKDSVILNIKYDGFIADYNDFCYQSHIGLDEERKNNLLHMVIVVRKHLKDKIIHKKKVKFYDVKKSSDNSNAPSSDEEKKEVGEREVWVENDCATIGMLLLNILGEYHLLHHVGLIEILPEDDPLISSESEFKELCELKNEIDLVAKFDHMCNYCQHNDLQVKLFKCGGCKKIEYCGAVCQKLDWPSHKLVCKCNE
jgi:hypothetical protein